MPPTQASYAKKELNLLKLVTQPSGKSIDQLAQQMAEYERVQVRAAEVFATDPMKLQAMQKITHDPKTRPDNFFSLDEPGATIHMFGKKGSVRVDELNAALARYDEVLKKKCDTFEDHFSAVHHAFLPYLLVDEYFVRDPLLHIPGALAVYGKRRDELSQQIVYEEVPHRCAKLPCESEATLKKRRDGFGNASFSASSSRDYATATPIPLITADEAKDLLNLSNLPTLFRSKFQTLDDSAHDPADTHLDPDSWRVATIDVDLETYGIVFPDISDPIPFEKGELIHLLTQSKRVA